MKKTIIILLLVIALVGCSNTKTTTNISNTTTQPLSTTVSSTVATTEKSFDINNQDFTISNELYNLLSNGVYIYNQIDQNHLLFAKDGNYTLYTIDKEKLEPIDFTANYIKDTFTEWQYLVYVNPDAKQIIYSYHNTLTLADFDGNIIKQVDAGLFTYQEGDYLVTWWNDQDTGVDYTAIYDQNLDLQNQYQDLKISSAYMGTGDTSLFPNCNVLTYDENGTQLLYNRIVGFDANAGELYLYSDGQMQYLTDGLEGNALSKVQFINDEYLISVRQDDNSLHYYVYNNQKLVDLGDSSTILQIGFADIIGDVLMSKGADENNPGNYLVDIYNSQKDQIETYDSNVSNRFFYIGGSYYLVDEVDQNQAVLYGSDQPNPLTLTWTSDKMLLLTNVYSIENQLLAIGKFVDDPDHDSHYFWLKDGQITQINDFYYNSLSDTLTIISNDNANAYFFKNGQLLCSTDNQDITGFKPYIYNDNIITIAGSTVKFYDFDGQLESQGTLLSSETAPGVFLMFHKSYANRLVLMDSDNLDAKLIAVPE